jgi:hypothetical protein
MESNYFNEERKSNIPMKVIDKIINFNEKTKY